MNRFNRHKNLTIAGCAAYAAVAGYLAVLMLK